MFGGGFWHEEGWRWGLAAGMGAERTVAGQAIEREAETVKEKGVSRKASDQPVQWRKLLPEALRKGVWV